MTTVTDSGVDLDIFIDFDRTEAVVPAIEAPAETYGDAPRDNSWRRIRGAFFVWITGVIADVAYAWRNRNAYVYSARHRSREPRSPEVDLPVRPGDALVDAVTLALRAQSGLFHALHPEKRCSVC